MNKESIPCGLYVRVSSQNQLKGDYNSLETQREKLEAYCKSQEGYQIYKVYVDGAYSADSLDRPALQEMLSDIRQKQIKCVLAYKIDRLTRSVKDFHNLMDIFDEYSVTFVSTTQNIDTNTPTGRLMRNILLDFAQFEREMTADRTRDKMHQRAEKGMWNGGCVPFGYKAEDKKLVPDPVESRILQFMFQQYAKMPSVAQLRESLGAKGYKNRGGKVWGKTTIKAILSNPVYVGKIRFGNMVYEGGHEPLVEEPIFNMVQKMEARRVHVYGKHERTYLLKGLLKCPLCGSQMTPHYTQKKKQDGTRYAVHYYTCTKTLKHGVKICHMRSLNADLIEGDVVKHLAELSHDKEFVESTLDKANRKLSAKSAVYQKEAHSLQGRIKQIEGKISSIIHAVGNGTLTGKHVKTEIEGLEESKAKLDAELEEVQRNVNQNYVAEFDLKIVMQSLRTFAEGFENLTTGGKVESIQNLLKSVTVHADHKVLEVFEMPVLTTGSSNRSKWLP